MGRILSLSAAAEQDLIRIQLWFTQPGADTRARARREAIAQAIRDLVRYPTRWPFSEHPGIRKRPVEGHFILYRIAPDTGNDRTAGDVEVMRIFGPGQSRARL